MLTRKLARVVCAAGMALVAAGSWAQLRIDLQSKGIHRLPILIEPFADESKEESLKVSKVVFDDLDRTGLFRPKLNTKLTTLPFEEPDYDNLLAKGHEYLLVGQIRKVGRKDKEVVFQLIDLVTKQAEQALSFTIEPGKERLIAHSISNWVYERLIGESGVFNSKIAYVLKSGPKLSPTYELTIADYDGHNPFVVARSFDPIISPDWHPNGNRLYYVSYEEGKPIIYEHDLITGEQRTIANFRGNNSAPSVSPNEDWIAVALSESGNTQIYLLSMDGSRKLRLRASAGINTEPVFSPNNRDIAFVSDETGSPQIWLRNRVSGAERRLTFNSSYNVSPEFSRDGRHLTFVRRDQNGFNVHMLNLDNPTRTIPLTGLPAADSPSFSPDSRMLLFKNERRGNVLYTVSVNGKIARKFTIEQDGEIRDPTWGPASSRWY